MRTLFPLFLLPLATAAPALADEVVTVPHFTAVGLKNGGTVRIVPGAVQRVILHSGSTAYSRIWVRDRSLEIEGCHGRSCPANYRLDVEIQTPNLDAVAVSNGGKMQFAPGFRPQGDIAAAVSNGGMIDMRTVPAREVSAAVNSGGLIEVGAPAELSAAVNSGGAIRYRGNPDLSMAVASGGSVERAQ